MQGSIHEMRTSTSWAYSKQILVRENLYKDEDGPTVVINLELGREGQVYDDIDLFIKHRETLVALRDAAKRAIAHFDAKD